MNLTTARRRAVHANPRARAVRTAAWWGVVVALLCAYGALAGLLAALWTVHAT